MAYFLFSLPIFLIPLKIYIEKYIFEYDYVNPFQALMFEGLFGLIFVIFFCFFENPFKEIKDFYNDEGIIKIVGLMVCLAFYFLFSGGKNVYRVLTNKLYSPITKSLADSILEPVIIIYFYKEFPIKFHLIINIFLSFIIDFCACVYNEFLVLFCCKLAENTYLEVSKRAKIRELNEIINDDEDSNSDYENNENKKAI